MAAITHSLAHCTCFSEYMMKNATTFAEFILYGVMLIIAFIAFGSVVTYFMYKYV